MTTSEMEELDALALQYPTVSGNDHFSYDPPATIKYQLSHAQILADITLEMAASHNRTEILFAIMRDAYEIADADDHPSQFFAAAFICHVLQCAVGGRDYRP